MYRVERPNGLARKRPTGAIDDIRPYPQHLPVRSRGREMRSTVGRIGFREIAESVPRISRVDTR